MRKTSIGNKTNSKKKAVAVVAALSITASGVGYVGLNSSNWAKADEKTQATASDGTYTVAATANEGGNIHIANSSGKVLQNGEPETFNVSSSGSDSGICAVPDDGYIVGSVVVKSGDSIVETFEHDPVDEGVTEITDSMANNQDGHWVIVPESVSAGTNLTYDVTFIPYGVSEQTNYDSQVSVLALTSATLPVVADPNIELTPNSVDETVSFHMSQAGADERKDGFTNFSMSVTKFADNMTFDKSSVVCKDSSGNTVPGEVTIELDGSLKFTFSNEYLSNGMAYNGETYTLEGKAKYTGSPSDYLKLIRNNDNSTAVLDVATTATTATSGGNKTSDTTATMNMKLPVLDATKTAINQSIDGNSSTNSANIFDTITYEVTINNKNTEAKAKGAKFDIRVKDALYALGVTPIDSSVTIEQDGKTYSGSKTVTTSGGVMTVTLPDDFVWTKTTTLRYQMKVGRDGMDKAALNSLNAAVRQDGAMLTNITCSTSNAKESVSAAPSTKLLVPRLAGSSTFDGSSTLTWPNEEREVTIPFQVGGEDANSTPSVCLKNAFIKMSGDLTNVSNITLDGQAFTPGSTVIDSQFENNEKHVLKYKIKAPSAWSSTSNGTRNVVSTLDGINALEAHNAQANYTVALPHMTTPVVKISNTKPSATDKLTISSTFSQDADGATACGARFVITDKAHEAGKDSTAHKFQNIKINGKDIASIPNVTYTVNGDTLTIDYGNRGNLLYITKGENVTVTYDDEILGSYHANGYTNDVTAKVEKQGSAESRTSNITNEPTSTVQSYTVQTPAFSVGSSVDKSTPSAEEIVHAKTVFTQTDANAKATGARFVITDIADVQGAIKDQDSTEKDDDGNQITPVDPVKERFQNIKLNGKAITDYANVTYNVEGNDLVINYTGVMTRGAAITVEYDDALIEGFNGNKVTNNISGRVVVDEKYNVSKEVSGAKASFTVAEPAIDITKSIISPEVTEDNVDDDGHLIVNVGDTVEYAVKFHQSAQNAIGRDFEYTETIDPEFAKFGVVFGDDVVIMDDEGDDAKDITENYNVELSDDNGTMTITGKDGYTDLPNKDIVVKFKIDAGVTSNKAYDQLAGKEFETSSKVTVTNLPRSVSADIDVAIADAKAVVKKEAEKEEIANGDTNTYTITATNEFEGEHSNSKLRGLKLDDELDKATAEFGYKIDPETVKVTLDDKDITDETDVYVLKMDDDDTGFELTYNKELTKDSILKITYDTTTENISAQSYDQSLGNVVIATARNSKPSVDTEMVAYHGAEIVQPEQEQSGSIEEPNNEVVDNSISQAGDNNTMIYVIGGVIAIAVIAGATIIIVRKRNK